MIGEVLHVTYQNQNAFIPFARNPLRVTSEYLGNFFLLPKGMLGDASLLSTNMNYGNTDTAPLKCECRCLICPNLQNYCPNYGQFSSFGDATASHASPCGTLMKDDMSRVLADKMTIDGTFSWAG